MPVEVDDMDRLKTTAPLAQQNSSKEQWITLLQKMNGLPAWKQID